jgi:hypothetical protein
MLEAKMLGAVTFSAGCTSGSCRLAADDVPPGPDATIGAIDPETSDVARCIATPGRGWGMASVDIGPEAEPRLVSSSVASGDVTPGCVVSRLSGF